METNQNQNIKTRIYNLIILDKSGSMESIRQAAFTGCNEVLNGISINAKKHIDTQEHFVSLLLFDTESMPYILDMVPANNLRLMKEEEFCPCACTPLLDAMGSSLLRLEQEIDKHERAIAMVTVITDGYENASTEFNYTQIQNLIERLRNKGWNFAFMGANQDVKKVSIDLNINVENAVSFDFSDRGIRHAFQKMQESTAEYYCAMADTDREISSSLSKEERFRTYRQRMDARSFFRKKDN
jgi:hypothetical protein